jgi:hypothetical protein
MNERRFRLFGSILVLGLIALRFVLFGVPTYFPSTVTFLVIALTFVLFLTDLVSPIYLGWLIGIYVIGYGAWLVIDDVAFALPRAVVYVGAGIGLIFALRYRNRLGGIFQTAR